MSFLKISEKIVLNKLKKIKNGNLKLINYDGKVFHFGSLESNLSADIKINNPKFYFNIISGGSSALGEAHMNRDFYTSNLTNLIEISAKNIELVYSFSGSLKIKKIKNFFKSIFASNTKSKSLHYISKHYDLGNNFFSKWLDKTLTYSSAVYENENDSLEIAQKNKYQKLIDLLNVKDGNKVLEIGCGWGGFLEHASNQGYLVKGITISPSQFKFAQDRIENLEIVPDIELIDYRLLEGKFDAVVSIEMFEAVGSEYWNSYFQKIQNVLKPNAKAVIQTITMTEDYFEGYDKWPDFIQTYIFPGGELASDKLFIDKARKFDLENIKTTNFAKSYAKTLETWYENFQIAWRDIEEMGFDAKFKRTWDMYLAYCRGGFLNGQLEVSQYLLKVK